MGLPSEARWVPVICQDVVRFLQGPTWESSAIHIPAIETTSSREGCKSRDLNDLKFGPWLEVLCVPANMLAPAEFKCFL